MTRLVANQRRSTPFFGLLFAACNRNDDELKLQSREDETMRTASLATLILSVVDRNSGTLTTAFTAPSRKNKRKLNAKYSYEYTSSKEDSFLSNVIVFDSVFSKDVCNELNMLAAEHVE